MRYLAIGAHPDDCDLIFGGTALKLIAAGHEVMFVSVTDGRMGHHIMTPEQTVARRIKEAEAAGKALGLVDYKVLSHPDGDLVPTLEIRKELIGIIRQFAPDMVLSHRTCDYHPDHRAAGQLATDATFLIGVPHYCQEYAIPENRPVFAFAYDNFTHPEPFRIDAAVDVTEIIDRKLAAADKHVSQFYEWLPFDMKLEIFDPETTPLEQRIEFLKKHFAARDRAVAKLAAAAGFSTGEFAEVFELSEYGRQVTVEEFRQMLCGA